MPKKRKPLTPEERHRRWSESRKQAWADPAYREKMLEVLKANRTGPCYRGRPRQHLKGVTVGSSYIVHKMRREGISWTEIGAVLGVEVLRP